MRPAARLQSAIELVDQIILAARDGGASADQIAKRFFAERRYAGSKDRRAVRDLAWGVIRRFGKRPVTARSAFAAKEWRELERWIGTKAGKRALAGWPKVVGAFGRSFGKKVRKLHRRKRR